MCLAIVDDQGFVRLEVVIVEDIPKNIWTWFSVVQVAAEDGLDETLANKVEPSMSVEVINKKTGIGDVAVAQKKESIASFQLPYEFDMPHREIDNEGVPGIDNLSICKWDFEHTPYMIAEVFGGEQSRFVLFGHALTTKHLIGFFDFDSIVAETAVQQLQIKRYDGAAKVEYNIFYSH